MSKLKENKYINLKNKNEKERIKELEKVSKEINKVFENKKNV